MSVENVISRLGLDLDTSGLRRGVVELDKFSNAAKRAEAQANKIEAATTKLTRQMAQMQSMVTRVAAAFGGFLAVSKVIAWGDAWTSASNQIRLVTANSEELRAVTAEVYAIAQRTASKMEGTSGLYAAIQRAAGEAIGSQKEVLRLTETISKLTAAGGGPASSRDSALFQLRQALGGAVLQAQEFNSLIDGAPLLVDAIAKGFGKTRSEMKKLVNDGKADIPTVIKALQTAGTDADKLFGKINFTVGDAMVRMSNAMQMITGTTAGPALKNLANGISALAENIGTVSKVATVAGVALAVMFAPQIAAAALALTANIAGLVTGMATGGPVALGFAATLQAVRGAIVAVTAAIAANPLGAIAVALAAAGTAALLFADRIGIAKTQVRDFAEDGSSQLRTIDVTLSDVMDSAAINLDHKLKAMGESFKSFGSDMRPTLQLLAEDFGTTLEDIADNIVLSAINAVKRIPGASILLGQTAKTVDDVAASAAALARFRASRQYSNADLTKSLDAILATQEKASAAAGEASKKVLEQRAAIAQAMRDAQELARVASDAVAGGATVKGLEQQLELQQRINALLKSAPEHYKAAGRARAEEDAKAEMAAEAQIRAAQQVAKLMEDISRAPRLAEALRIGRDEYDTLQRTFDLLDEQPDNFARMAEETGRSAEAIARMYAQADLAQQKVMQRLEQQAERAHAIAEAPWRNFEDRSMDLVDDFWTRWADKGLGAVKGIGDALNDLFTQLRADILRKMFDPLRQSIVNSISGAIQGSMQSGGNSVTRQAFAASEAKLWQASYRTTGPANDNSASAGMMGLNLGLGRFGNNAAVALALAGGGGMKNLMSLGLLGGNGAIGELFAHGALKLGLGNNVAAGLGNFGNLFNPQNALAGMAGSGLANLLGLGGGAGGSIGGSIGGIAGAMTPLGPVGAAIGSFIGTAIGGLFKTGTSSRNSGVTLDAAGNVTSTVGKNSNENTLAMVQAAAQAVSSGLDMIKQLGGTSTTRISSLELAENRKSTIGLVTGPGKWSTIQSAQGDPAAAANAGLNAVLSATTFTNKTLDSLAKAMQKAGKDFDTTATALQKVNAIIGDGKPALSQWEQSLKDLYDVFNPLIVETKKVSVAVANDLTKALVKAREDLRGKFADGISDAIGAIEAPLAQQFEALFETQVQRIKDANALGVKQSVKDDVLKLNQLELQQFLESAAGNAGAFSNLNDQFQKLIDKAKELGQSTAPIQAAFDAAKATLVTSFNQDIAQQFGNLTNPTLSALTTLLEAQKARLKQAQDIGASTVAVQRLNALEQQKFFEGLSTDQKRQLGDYLGLIQDFTGQIGVTLTKLGDELSARIDDMETRRAELEARASTFGGFAKGIADTRQSLTDRYSALTPMASLEALRSRFGGLVDAGKGGNESALQALPQVAEQLLSLSRDLYGSTKTFRGDFDTVDRLLAEVGLSAQGRADEATSQAATLVQQKDLLTQIRDSIQSPDPALDFLQQQVGLLDENNGLIAQLLQSYLDLTDAQGAQSVNDQALLNNALLAAIQAGGAAQSADPTAFLSALSQSGAAANANQAAQSADLKGAIDNLTHLVSIGFGAENDVQEDILRELKKISMTLSQQQAA